MYDLKVSKISVIMILTYLLAFFSTRYIPQYDLIRYIAIVIIAVYLFPKISTFFKRKYAAVNIALISFSFLALYNSWISRSLTNSRDTFKSAALFVVSVLLTFFVMEYAAYCSKISVMLKLYYKLTLLTVIITDGLIFLAPSLVYRYNSNYFVGTKFKVSYIHIYLIVFFMLKMTERKSWQLKDKILMIFYCLLTVFMSVRVNCMTGIVGLLILLIICLLFYIKKVRPLMLNPVFYIVVLLVSCSFMFIYEKILNNAVVQNFVVDTLGRNITLTGRTRIYNILPELLQMRLWTGYGIGSSYEICMKYGSFPNAQNGLAEWVLMVGLPATVILIVLIYLVIHSLHNNDWSKKTGAPGLIVLYVLGILASVEISINLEFFVWLAILAGTAFQNEVGQWESLKVS